jgi:hypothetical protein
MTTRAVERTLEAYPDEAERFQRMSPYARTFALKKLENSLRKLQHGTTEALPGGCQLHRPKFDWDIEFRTRRKPKKRGWHQP